MDATIKAPSMRMGIKSPSAQVYVVTRRLVPAALIEQVDVALVVAPFLRNNNHSLSAIAPDTKSMEGMSAWAIAA